MSGSLATVFLQGMGIGLAVAAPVGPVSVLCMKRTVERGPVIGLATGLGAAVADGVYGGVAAFGLGAAASAWIEQAFWFRLCGGMFLVLLGVRTLLAMSRAGGEAAPRSAVGKGRDAGLAFGSTILITLSNPATILTFAGIFAGISFGALGSRFGASLALTAGVFAGSAVWWLVLVAVTARFRHRLSVGAQRLIDLVSGSVFLIFGAVVLWQAAA